MIIIKPFIEYDSYPDKINKVRLNFDSNNKYQDIEIKETLITESSTNKETLLYETEFRVVDNQGGSVTVYKMSRDELNSYINVLKHILSQTK